MKTGLKDFKDNEIKDILDNIKKSLQEYGIDGGQIQVEDSKNSIFTRGNDITETEPVIISTGSGILLVAKLDF